MGMAKYYEDNIEIMEERYSMWRYTERTDYSQAEMKESNTICVITTKIKEKTTSKKAKNKTKAIECCECRRRFEFTGGEQHYYEKHNLLEPKRCPECRKQRKEMFRTINQK